MIAPVQRSVIFEFDTARRFGEVMEDASLGYLYSRIRNPSGDELAGAVAALEGAEAAHCSASGMAAINGALRLLAPPGAGIVAGTRLYGQTHAVLRSRDDVTFVELDDEAAVARAVEGASVLYAETISNPRCDVADLPALAGIAHAAGARLLVDNTMASPVGCRPLALGADLVVHSATKYLNGHSDAVAGVAAGPADLVARLAADEVDTGAMLSPDSAWLVRRGLRTLPLRWERECENALAIARFLEADARVAGVFYPGLPSHPHHERAQAAAERRRRRAGVHGHRRPGRRGAADGPRRALPARDQPGWDRDDAVASRRRPATASSPTASWRMPASTRGCCACRSAARTSAT